MGKLSGTNLTKFFVYNASLSLIFFNSTKSIYEHFTYDLCDLIKKSGYPLCYRGYNKRSILNHRRKVFKIKATDKLAGIVRKISGHFDSVEEQGL